MLRYFLVWGDKCPVFGYPQSFVGNSIETKKLTPLMQQYWEVKSVHMDKILFFRMGDFYEIFEQDAVTAAPILGIALTSRNKNSPESTAMCGMPHHSAAQHINKLLAQNFKVAICDQVEDAAVAKGLVKRAITRILSPGMVYDPDTIDQIQNNYLCSYDQQSISFLEATTGECFFYLFQNEIEKQKLIGILQPVELILSQQQHQEALEDKKTIEGPCLTQHQDLSGNENLRESSRRLLSYATYMQGEKVLLTLQEFKERKLSQKLELNFQTLRHLEIFETYKGDTKNSFFHAINKTKTAAGSRKLKNWLLFPLQRKEDILERQDQIEAWIQRPQELKEVRSIFSRMGDIERRLGKISNPNCNARDFISLKESIKAGLEISKYNALLLPKGGDRVLVSHVRYFEGLGRLVEVVERTVVEEPPLSTKNGHMIRQGFSESLDQLIELSTNSQGLLNEMEQRERDQNQIPSLKIRYNQVFGFYIEITKAHLDKVPKHYVRKQTLTNAERFMTDELYKLEGQVLTAKTKREELEFAIFDELRTEILKNAAELLKSAQAWSEIDVVTSLAWLAIENNFVKPVFNLDRSLKIKASRHPVIEQIQNQFIPNDIEIHPHGCMLLTGPNMAGKSTLMRQVALTVLLAQIGSNVPATQASLPIFDRLFTRIGASDSLTEGLSTFMVEMTETAFLLKNATENSLVILDEIGRGTSTYDGMSLAHAILEYLVTQVRSLTLFATHYHELTSLQSRYTQIENAHMKVAEKLSGSQREISFLYTLTRGPANKSYGIEVAKLAGLPAQVTTLARKILEQKEQNNNGTALPLFNFQESELSNESTETVAPGEWQKVINEIQSSSLTRMTPLEALNKIANWQKELN